jgi:hypothetical protein
LIVNETFYQRGGVLVIEMENRWFEKQIVEASKRGKRKCDG